MLQLNDVYKVYGEGEGSVAALRGIELSINAHELISIVGTSGSGKSTLLNILSGLDLPTKGEVVYKNNNINNFNNTKLAKLRRREFGFIFQFFNLVNILTVEENIILPILMDGKKPDKDYISNLIDLLGIKNKMHTFPSKLSGGQQQRVAIARALSAKPSIVFADEPTGNLDSNTSKEILDILMTTYTNLKQTIIIVTHDNKIAENCKRQIEISDGIIINDIKG